VAARALSQGAPLGNFPEVIAANYGLPAGLTGEGQMIALVEMGGGYDPVLMQQYFNLPGRNLNRSGSLTSYPSLPAPPPTSNPSTDDIEVQLDLEVAGSVAPAADIAVFFGAPEVNAPIDDWAAAFLLTVNAAIHSTPTPAAVSISWGFPEDSIDPQDGAYAQDVLAMQQSFETAAALNTTVLVASGDSGANDGEQGPTADFPSCCPGAVACGGTMLDASNVEVAWNDDSGSSGGGYSRVFAQSPDYQSGIGAISGQGRGVPDVAGIASYHCGYHVVIDRDYEAAVGGTSAVAPLMAGFVAVANAHLGRTVGPINAKLYANTQELNDIVSGNNNGYSAGPGWDPVTGLGSPKFGSLMGAL
jgi:kumamolisin